jgi:hypothetical protein
MGNAFIAEANNQKYNTGSASATITPDYKSMYDTANQKQNDLIGEYRGWSDQMQAGVRDAGTGGFKAYEENAAESVSNRDAQNEFSAGIMAEQKAQQAAFEAAAAENLRKGNISMDQYNAEIAAYKSNLDAKTSEYDKWAQSYRDKEGDIANRYNAKADRLQEGYIPQTFINNEQAILQDTANSGMASLLKQFANSGTINSSLARQGVNDLGYGITKTMNESYKDTIDKLMGYATTQATTENTLRNDDYTIGQSGYKQGFDNIKQQTGLSTERAKSYGDLLAQNYATLSDSNKSIMSAIGDRYTVGDNMYDFNANEIKYRGDSAASAYKTLAQNYQDQFKQGNASYQQQVQNAWMPMQSASAAQEYQNNNLYKMISAINSLNSAGTNAYNNTTSTINKATGEGGTVVTQNQDNTGSVLGGVGSILGALAKF